MTTLRRMAAAYATVLVLMLLSHAVAGVQVGLVGLLGGPAVVASMFLIGVLSEADPIG
jgi:hypothetical protein